MSKQRTLVVVVGLLVIALVFALQGFLQRSPSSGSSATPQPGMIHCYVDGAFVANVAPSDMAALPTGSFVDAEKSKTQEGPWLKDVILLYVKEGDLSPGSLIRVEGKQSKTDEAKGVSLSWAEIQDTGNHVIFDIATSGDSIKLVSTLPDLDTRDEWVQGVARIDVTTKP